MATAIPKVGAHYAEDLVWLERLISTMRANNVSQLKVDGVEIRLRAESSDADKYDTLINKMNKMLEGLSLV